MRIQRIIAERFLPILDDVFVQHKTHILRTTAISGGVTCIAGILGSKSVELKASGIILHMHGDWHIPAKLVPTCCDQCRNETLSVSVMQLCLSQR